MVVIVVFYRRLGEDGGDEFCSERSHQSKKKERKQDAQFRASQWFRGVVHGSGGLIVQLVKADGIVSCGFRSVKINLVTDWVVWGTRGTTQQRSSSIFFSAGDPCEQFWHGHGCPLFDVVHPAFLLLITTSSTLQGDQRDGFGEAVVACDMSKSCKFLSLDSCQERFLWTHKEVDLAPHPVVGLVFQVQ